LSVIDGEFLGSLSQRGNLAEHTRFGAGQAKQSPEGIINNTGGALYGAQAGEFFDAYDGDLEFSFRLRNTGGLTHSGYAFAQLLESSMLADITGTIAGTTAVLGAGPFSTTAFDVALIDATNFIEGGVIAFTKNNITEFTRVTQVVAAAAATITVSPALSFIPVAGTDTVRHCATWYPTIGTSPVDAHVRVDLGDTGTGAPIRRLASGCRLRSLALDWDEETAIAAMTVAPARVLEDDANADVAATVEPPGAALQRYGCEQVIGADISGAVAPFAATRASLSLFGWSATIDFELSASAPNSKSLLRMSDHEINAATCRVELRPEYGSTLKDMLRLEEERTFVLGMGPTGTGQGGVLIVTGSRDDGTANPAGADGDRIEMPVAIRATTFTGANVTPQTELSQAPFVFAMPVG